MTASRSSIALAVGGFLLGLTAGYYLYRARPAAPEGPLPAQVVPGGQILARDPERKLPPPPVVPRGAKIERQVEVIVQPTTSGPVDLDIALLRLHDGTHRVEVTTPNGTILGGVDVPMDIPAPPRVLRNSIGAIYGPDAYGVYYDRDFGPFRAGVEVTRNRHGPAPGLPPATDWRIKAGIRF